MSAARLVKLIGARGLLAVESRSFSVEVVIDDAREQWGQVHVHVADDHGGAGWVSVDRIRILDAETGRYADRVTA